MSRRVIRLVVVTGAVLVGTLACTPAPRPEPVDVTQDVPRPTASGEGLQVPDACAAVAADVVERLVPGATGEPNAIGGESYASAGCDWVNDGSELPSARLSVVLDVTVAPEGTDPRDVLEGVCLTDIGADGPGELACTDVTSLEDGPATFSQHAVEGSAVADVLYVREGVGPLDEAAYEALEEVALDLLAATPQP